MYKLACRTGYERPETAHKSSLQRSHSSNDYPNLTHPLLSQTEPSTFQTSSKIKKLITHNPHEQRSGTAKEQVLKATHLTRQTQVTAPALARSEGSANRGRSGARAGEGSGVRT